MQRIHGLTDDQVRAFEARIEQQMVDSLQYVMDTIARRIERNAMPQVAAAMALTAAVTTGPDGDDDPPPQSAELEIPPPEPEPNDIPATPDLPPGQPYVSPDDLASIAPLWQEQVTQQLVPIAAEVLQTAGQAVLAQLVDKSGVAALPKLGNLAAETYLRQQANTFDQVGDHLWHTARAQLAQGFEAGESIPQLAARLRQSAGLTARTGVLVARTSVIESSNFGSLATARASGLAMQKEWIATPDIRTRPTHLAADGQRVDINAKFTVGGHAADFPADPDLPPSERYSCRCTTGYIMPERPKRLPDATPEPDLAQLPGTSGVATEIEPLDLTPAVDEALTLPKASGTGVDQPAYGDHAPSYVRPSLRDAKTPRALRRAWQDEVQAITGYPFLVDAMPRGISLATAREYAEGTLQMFTQFPAAKMDRIHWFDEADGPYARVRSGGHAIEFNMRYASEAGRPKLLAGRRKDVTGWESGTTGWSVRNDVPTQGVVYHEFAHVIDEENLRRAIHPMLKPLMIRHATAEGVTDIDDLIKRRISSYATSDSHEMIAEAVTDVMVNGQAASAMSREIYDLMVAEYRRRGFAIRSAEPLDDLAAEAEREGLVFPKAAAPKTLASQTVAQLRTLAKERGITVPPGTRKADLVRMLDEAPPTVAPVDLAAQAVARQAAIDAARKTAQFATRIDEIIANAATPKALTHTIDTLGRQAGLSDAELGALRALVDDRPALLAAVRARASGQGVEVLGSTNDVVRFDRRIHQGIDGDLRQGQTVQVVRPASQVRIGDELVPLDKATVEATDLPLSQATPTPAGPVRELAPPPPLSRAPAAVQARQAQLREDAARPVLADKSRRQSGANAITTQVEHKGGPPTITKDFSRLGEGPSASKRRADAEELGALTSEAVGIRAPAVIRTGPRSVEMEHIDGQLGDEITRVGQPIEATGITETDEGRLLGLADILMGNSDRNGGNWMRLADGHLVAIDHEDAFYGGKLIGADDPFGAALVGRKGLDNAKWPKVIDINPADLVVIRARLEGLRPEFERLGRATWHRQVMARLAEVEKRADPNAVIRLAEARPDLATTKAAARAAARERAAAIGAQRGTAALLARVDELVASKASKAVIRQELDPALRAPEQLYAGADDAVAEALAAALDSGDLAKLRSAITRSSTRAKIKPIGKAGAKAKFDPATMEGVGGVDIPDGADVVVVRRGATLQGVETPEKAVVRLDVKPVKAAPTKPFSVPTVEQMADTAGVSRADVAEIRRLTRTLDRPPRIVLNDDFDDRFAQTHADSQVVKEFAQRHQAIYNRIVQEQSITRHWSEVIAPSFARGGRSLAEVRSEAVDRLRAAIDGQPVIIRRATESRLRQALDDGRLKTQFETGTSSGVLDPEMRANFEAMDFDYPVDLPGARRPVYGYVSPNGVRPAIEDVSLTSSYGDIQLVLRDSTRPRITVTAADSLDHRRHVRPSPIDKIDWRSTLGHDVDYASEDYLDEHYVEAQIHGGVTWDDVAEVVFARKPEASTVAALKLRGVAWRVLTK